MSAMIHLELSHVNVLTKCDLLSKKEKRTVRPEPKGNVETAKVKAEGASSSAAESTSNWRSFHWPARPPGTC